MVQLNYAVKLSAKTKKVEKPRVFLIYFINHEYLSEVLPMVVGESCVGNMSSQFARPVLVYSDAFL